MFRQFHLRVGRPEVSRIRDPARQGLGGGGFRAAEIDAVLACPRSSGEIPWHRSKAVATRSRSLPHADAAVAAGLVDPGTGMDEIPQQALRDEILENLTRTGVDV